jgi:hypothetical protein
MMEQAAASDRVSEDQKAVFEYMLKKIKARVAELEAANQAKETD